MTMRVNSLLYAPSIVAGLLAVFAMVPAAALPVFEFGQPKPAKVQAPLKQLEFKILKLSCASCAASYLTVLQLTPGIRYARVELRPPRDAESLVIYDSRFVKPADILDALHKFHYYEGDVKQR